MGHRRNGKMKQFELIVMASTSSVGPAIETQGPCPVVHEMRERPCGWGPGEETAERSCIVRMPTQSPRTKSPVWRQWGLDNYPECLSAARQDKGCLGSPAKAQRGSHTEAPVPLPPKDM